MNIKNTSQFSRVHIFFVGHNFPLISFKYSPFLMAFKYNPFVNYHEVLNRFSRESDPSFSNLVAPTHWSLQIFLLITLPFYLKSFM